MLFLVILFWLILPEQEGEEAGGATSQRHQGGDMVLGRLVGEMVKMEVTETITDQEEMVSIGLVRDKTEDSQGTKYQETVWTYQSCQLRPSR